MIRDSSDVGKNVNWAELYDQHPEYAQRRCESSAARAQVELEVQLFKLPHLLQVLGEPAAASLIEIGCATGELTGAFPVVDGGQKLGLDISPLNVEAARQRFPDCRFLAGDFRTLDLAPVDVVLMSDVVEHVPDDAAFLAAAARLGRRVLVNLPLECNWLNRGRAYGPMDSSGHLRAYTLEQGLGLFDSAGLRVQRWKRVWIHETPADRLLREHRREVDGSAFSGRSVERLVKAGVYGLSKAVRPLGRAMFASNLFVLAQSALNGSS